MFLHLGVSEATHGWSAQEDLTLSGTCQRHSPRKCEAHNDPSIVPALKDLQSEKGLLCKDQ
jgi:hypothetical protein